MKNQLSKMQKVVVASRTQLASAEAAFAKLDAAARAAKAKSRQLKSLHKQARSVAKQAKKAALTAQEKVAQYAKMLAKATRRLQKAVKKRKQGKGSPKRRVAIKSKVPARSAAKARNTQSKAALAPALPVKPVVSTRESSPGVRLATGS